MSKVRMIAVLLVCVQSVFSQVEELKNVLPVADISNEQIAKGLKEALTNGITNQVSTLAVKDGFYKNEMVKILWPEELKRVDRTLRNFGLSSLADEGLKILNRAAEDAVTEAIPIFVSAIKVMTFKDAKEILMGDERAATSFLEDRTSRALYEKFHPIILTSFRKVGADKVWQTIIGKYNALPVTKDVNPDLTAYATEEALKGVFTMVAIEEAAVRAKLDSRSTDLLKSVFSLQDKVKI